MNAVKIEDIMTTNVRKCFTSDSLAGTHPQSWSHISCAAAVLNEHAQVVGMLTDRDICMAAFFQRVPISGIKVFRSNVETAFRLYFG
jgi:CBS-domain-containing membrane protein